MIFFFSFLLGCEPQPPDFSSSKEDASLPDILLVTIDTLRADRLGCYGDPLAQTPNLDRLALDSVVFSEAHAVAPLTLPSHSSILTGLYPKNHGLRDNAGFRLQDEITTIAEVLKQQGYQTSAFISAFVLYHSWGLDQGFDLYHDPFHPQDVLSVGAFGEAELPAGEVLNQAKSWWRSAAMESPKFSWVHLYDPHAPWTPPSGWEGDPYRGEIAKVDRLLGSLFHLVDDDTLIIVTSDHGESLWEGGEREHTVLLGHGVTSVPLIIRPPKGISGEQYWEGRTPQLDVRRPDKLDQDLDLRPVQPRIKAGKIVHTPVSGVDIAPTIAAYAKGDLGKIDGVDLSTVITGEIAVSDRIVFAESVFPFFHFGWHPLMMLQGQELRLEHGQESVFLDPQTLEPKSSELDYLALIPQYFGEELPEPGQVSDTEAAALQQLGYLTDSISIEMNATPDPRKKMETLSRLRQAEMLPLEEAISELRKLIAEEPNLITAKLDLVYRLSADGQLQEALDICLAVVEENPLQLTALNNAILLATRLNNDQQAISLARQMLIMNPEDIRAYRYLVAIYMRQDRKQEVIEIGLKGLEKAPHDPNLNYLVGLCHIDLKQYSQSVPLLQSALQYGSRASDIQLWLGVAHQKQALFDRALHHYEKAAKDLPLDYRPYGLAGVMLAENGRCSEAKKYLLNVFGRGGKTADVIQAMQSCGIQPR